MQTNYKKKILIIGASGYIGNSLVNTFKQKKKFELNYIISNKSNKFYYKNKTNVFKINDTSNYFIKKIKKINTIYFLSSNENIYNSDSFELNSDVTNLLLKVINLLIKYNNKAKLIYVSSENAHGNVNNHKDYPLNLYGIEKLLNEKIIEIYSFNYNLNFLSLRLSNIYGFTENLDNNFKSSLNRIVINLFNKNELNLYKNKKCIRSFTNINDVCNILITIIDKKKIFNGKVYYFGNNEKITFQKVINLIKNQYIKKFPDIIKVNNIDKKLSNFEMRNFYLLKKNNLWYIFNKKKYKNIRKGIDEMILDYIKYYKK